MLDEVIRLLLDPMALFTIFWSMTLGIIMGAMPGLTGPMAMALLLGIAYTMPTEYSILAMMLIYMGGVYGGSLSAILLNIPGAPASAATAIDGYQLAQQGKAGRAIALTTISSCIGTLIAVAFMAYLTPWLVKVSLLFTSWELLLLVLLGIVMAGALSGDDPIKGWIAGLVGLLLAQIGLDDLHMHPRFSYGSHYLEAGLGLVAAIVGLFGISQVIVAMRERDVHLKPVTMKIGRIMPTFEDLKGRTQSRPAIRGDRQRRRHPAGPGCGYGGLDLLRLGQAHEPQPGALRQGLDRGRDRGRDRQQRRRPLLADPGHRLGPAGQCRGRDHHGGTLRPRADAGADVPLRESATSSNTW